MQRFCLKCKTWFRKGEGCPTCGYESTGFNKWLRTAQLNAHLYGEAGRVKKEATDSAHFVKHAKLEQKRVAGR